MIAPSEKDYEICGMTFEEKTALKLLGIEVANTSTVENSRPYALFLNGKRIAQYVLYNHMWDVVPDDDYFEYLRLLRPIIGSRRVY